MQLRRIWGCFLATFSKEHFNKLKKCKIQGQVTTALITFPIRNISSIKRAQIITWFAHIVWYTNLSPSPSCIRLHTGATIITLSPTSVPLI